MKTIGYLEHLDLGIDPDSGERNILVQSAQEYQTLTPEQKERAWATIKVASEIQEVSVAAVYKQAYSGKTPSKVIKKSEWDRHGLTLIKIPSAPKTKQVRREADIQRIVRGVRKSIKATRWTPDSQAVLIGALVDTKLRAIEREMFGKESKKQNAGIRERSHEQAEV